MFRSFFQYMVMISTTLGTLGVFAPEQSKAAPDVSGIIKIDGSSTAYMVSEAVAEEFQKQYPNVRVTLGISGTGGGFKKFLAEETDISDASRPITDHEREIAAAKKLEFVELPIAYDGIVVVVNPKNTWVTSLTVEELKRIWQPNSTVKTWNDVRAGWPKEKMNLYGPGTDSGTFDYFTEEICGKAKASRPDFSPSEDDNMLVQGISGDRNALGYFGFGYYDKNRDRLKLLGIVPEKGKEPIFPSAKTIETGTYRPLSRPLLIYVNKKIATKRPEVDLFVNFYLKQAKQLVAQVGYVPFPPEIYIAAQNRYEKRMTGTVFGLLQGETRQKNKSLKELLHTKGK